jgi:formylglycine-generating enzyme required for sulfatase activity
VATRRPNQYGLYDMIGNVWEWTHDVHGRPPEGPVVDPLGAEAGNRRVTKGCGWFRDARFCRAANRYRPKTTYTSSVVGFRPVRTIR